MPIRVPRGPKPAAEGPSDTDFMMALGQMSNLGRVPEGLLDPTPFDLRFRGMEPDFLRRLDQTKQGRIEDRRQNEDELAAQTQAAGRTQRATLRPYGQVVKALDRISARGEP
jgi:hypothetical protein